MLFDELVSVTQEIYSIVQNFNHEKHKSLLCEQRLDAISKLTALTLYNRYSMMDLHLKQDKLDQGIKEYDNSVSKLSSVRNAIENLQKKTSNLKILKSEHNVEIPDDETFYKKASEEEISSSKLDEFSKTIAKIKFLIRCKKEKIKEKEKIDLLIIDKQKEYEENKKFKDDFMSRVQELRGQCQTVSNMIGKPLKVMPVDGKIELLPYPLYVLYHSVYSEIYHQQNFDVSAEIIDNLPSTESYDFGKYCLKVSVKKENNLIVLEFKHNPHNGLVYVRAVDYKEDFLYKLFPRDIGVDSVDNYTAYVWCQEICGLDAFKVQNLFGKKRKRSSTSLWDALVFIFIRKKNFEMFKNEIKYLEENKKKFGDFKKIEKSDFLNLLNGNGEDLNLKFCSFYQCEFKKNTNLDICSQLLLRVSICVFNDYPNQNSLFSITIQEVDNRSKTTEYLPILNDYLNDNKEKPRSGFCLDLSYEIENFSDLLLNELRSYPDCQKKETGVLKIQIEFIESRFQEFVTKLERK